MPIIVDILTGETIKSIPLDMDMVREVVAESREALEYLAAYDRGESPVD